MNWLRTGLLLAALTALLLAIGNALGGQSGLIMALFFAVVMNFGAYWFSDKIVLRLYHAKPVSADTAPKLYSLVRELTAKAGLALPKIYIIEESAPNAFATGRNPEHAAIAVTTGILKILTKEELMGVLAHELSHVEHRDTLTMAIAATVAGAIGMLASMAQWAMIFGGRANNHEGRAGILPSLIMLIVAPLAASLIQLAISRSREFAADYRGAKICGNPLWLASALKKLESSNREHAVSLADQNPATAHLFIVNPLSGKDFAGLFMTHPPIAERIKRLESMV